MLVAIAPEERAPVFAAFSSFLCVLASYYCLLPLRDELGLVLGTSWLPSLFVLSLAATALAAPSVSAYLCRPGASRLTRLSRLYRAVAVVLVLFYMSFEWFSLPRAKNDGAQETSRRQSSVEKALICSFYLWNIVCISSLWARCAEVFSREAATRLFGLIGAGSTVGQLLGSVATKSLVHHSRASQPAFYLILAAAGAMAMAAQFLPWLTTPSLPELPTSKAPTPSAVHLLDGVRLIRRSTYLLHIGSYVVCSYAVAAQFYFLKVLVAETTLETSFLRTRWFATLNLYSGIFIALAQFTLTSRLLTRLPFEYALSLTPVVCCFGLLGVATTTQPSVIAVAEISRKILTYTLARPARETLFTVVAPEEKYKAKLIIDTILQRLGDVMGAAFFQFCRTGIALSTSHAAAASLLLSLVWGIAGWTLGRRQVQFSPSM